MSDSHTYVRTEFKEDRVDENKEEFPEGFNKVYDSYANIGNEKEKSEGRLTCKNLTTWMKQAGISDSSIEACVSERKSSLGMSEVKDVAGQIAKEEQTGVDEVMYKLVMAGAPQEELHESLSSKIEKEKEAINHEIESVAEKLMGSKD